MNTITGYKIQTMVTSSPNGCYPHASKIIITKCVINDRKINGKTIPNLNDTLPECYNPIVKEPRLDWMIFRDSLIR